MEYSSDQGAFNSRTLMEEDAARKAREKAAVVP